MITVFTSKHCKPCQAIGEMIEDGLFSTDGEKVELIDVETDEGYERFSKEVLSEDDAFVPMAYKDGARCEIMIDTDTGKLVFSCPAAQDLPSAED